MAISFAKHCHMVMKLCVACIHTSTYVNTYIHIHTSMYMDVYIMDFKVLTRFMTSTQGVSPELELFRVGILSRYCCHGNKNKTAKTMVLKPLKKKLMG